MQLFKEAANLDIEIKSEDASERPPEKRPPENVMLCNDATREELSEMDEWREPRALDIIGVKSVWLPHFSKRRVLVLGGTGLLGRPLLHELVRRRFAVTATSSRERKALHENVFAAIEELGVEYLHLPIEDDSDCTATVNDSDHIRPLTAALRSANLVVNLVADRGGVRWHGEQKKMNNHYLNALFPEKLAELAARVGVPMLHVSTEYVWSGERNSAEGYPAVLADSDDDRFARQGGVPYVLQKLEAERRLASSFGAITVLRVPTLYGKMLNSLEDGTLSSSIDNYMRENNWKHDTWQKRYPTSADDVAFVLGALVQKQLSSSLKQRVYHYGAQSSVSNYDFMCMFKAISGLDRPIAAESTEGRPVDRRPPQDVKLCIAETRAELSEVSDWREPRKLDDETVRGIWWLQLEACAKAASE